MSKNGLKEYCATSGQEISDNVKLCNWILKIWVAGSALQTNNQAMKQGCKEQESSPELKIQEQRMIGGS
jgi:hypothetical protein